MEKILKQPITVMDFATVVSDKKLKGSGLSKGDIVLVSSSKDVAFKKNDPWLKRTLFIVLKVVDGKMQVPRYDNEYASYVVDPRSLEKVPEEKFNELYNKNFTEKDDPRHG